MTNHQFMAQFHNCQIKCVYNYFLCLYSLLFGAFLIASLWPRSNDRIQTQQSWEVETPDGLFFSRLELGQKFKNQKSSYGYKIQVSVHLSLKLPSKHICQRGDIPSSTLPVFGKGHDVGHFHPFGTRIYITSTSFFMI